MRFSGELGEKRGAHKKKDNPHHKKTNDKKDGGKRTVEATMPKQVEKKKKNKLTKKTETLCRNMKAHKDKV